MLGKKISLEKIDSIMADGFPGGIPFPQNVPCPNHCKFCYEKDVPKLFPRIKVKYIPPFNNYSFAHYINNASHILQSTQGRMRRGPETPILRWKNKFYYFPKCDFFALGLTHQQIELILKHGSPLLAYTTGYNVDPDFIRYLIKKYPSKFRLSFSIITLERAFRSQLMNPLIRLDNLKKICAIAKNSIYFLLYLNNKQVISDIAFLNEFSIKNKNKFSLCKLYYSGSSPPLVRDYGRDADSKINLVVDYLTSNNRQLNNIASRLTLIPDSAVFTWARRKELRQLLSDCKDDAETAVFCSRGAYQVMREIFEKAHVIVPKSSFGGNIDIALSITVKEIIHEIQILLAQGATLSRIYIPETVFSIRRKYDFNLDQPGMIKKKFPWLKIVIINIPASLLNFELTVAECSDYYSNLHS